MKNRIAKLAWTAAVVAAFIAGVMAMRATTIIWGSMATLTTGTNYSSTAPLYTVGFPGKVVTIQHGGLLSTNNLPLYAQVTLGLDSSGSTNYVTFAGPWYPSATNAGTYTWNIAPTNFTIYGRGFTVQTNTVQVGGNVN